MIAQFPNLFDRFGNPKSQTKIRLNTDFYEIIRVLLKNGEKLTCVNM